MRGSISRKVANVTLAAGGLALSLIAGCTSYSSYPAPTTTLGTEDPNSIAPRITMTESLKFVINRYPLENRNASFAVAFPEGVNKNTAKRITGELGPNAFILTEETSGFPTYYVGRIWTRTDEAKVDVLRPVSWAPDNGRPAHEPITVTLEGGLKQWHVVRHKVWAVGSVDLPPTTTYEPDPIPEDETEFAEVPTDEPTDP